MKAFLQGKWLRHPLHPALVHIPTALFPLALVFDILTRLDAGGNAMVRAATYAILFGLLAIPPAIPTGFADWWDIKKERPAYRIGLIHAGLNGVAAVVWLTNLVWRWGERNTVDETATGPLVLSIVGSAVLAVSGWLGGVMVYDHGVSVVRHSKDKWRKIAVRGGAHVPTGERG